MGSGADDTADERPPGRVGFGTPPREGGLSELREVLRAAGEEQDRGQRIGFIGKRLGRFLISAELGRGGMATVYRARDPQLGRDVAVKVMHGFFAGRTEIEARFRREANAVAAIKHPSILALYDFAPPQGEEPGYIVSELVEGPGLRHLIDDCGGRLMPEVAGLITLRVAEALGAAHAAGIVHRDVKPDNVLLDRAGGSARVVLTDFGVAHVSGMDTMTATGAVLGSPAYMSPEQARGEEVGPPSDVFSVGVLLYQLCTGHLPFSGKDPLAVITAILRGDYKRPASLEARLGPDWDGVITRCLERDPIRRFSDGQAVAHAIRDLLVTVGLADEQAALRRYLSDPLAFEREVSPLIARQATAAGEQARRRRQIPRALAEVGRALAYAPQDQTALQLLERLGTRSRRLWLRAGVSGIGVVAVAGAFVLARPARIGPTPFDMRRPSAAEASATTPSRSQPATANVPPPALSPASSSAAPAPAAAPPVAGENTTHPRRKTKAAGARVLLARNRGARLVTDKDPASVAAVHTDNIKEDIKEDTKEDPAPSPLAAVAVAAAQAASVVLRASHGFCEPSLDALPASLRASYNGLVPGQHDIYCTLPQKGGKVHVATYDLRPGTRASLTIVPGPEGRPILGRPE